MENKEKNFLKGDGAELNALKSEHLKEGIKPIMASIGTFEQFKNNPGGLNSEYFLKFESGDPGYEIPGVVNVDWYADEKDLLEKGFIFAKDGAYIISPTNDLDKYSKGFFNCIGLIVVGKDKNTDENISFLIHQNPEICLSNSESKENLINDLKQKLLELKEKSADKTVDVAIFGGNHLSKIYGKYPERYLESVKVLSDEVKNVLGFEPVIITGPKTFFGRDDVFYDNKNRRLYIIRPEIDNNSAESYLPKDIEEQKKKW